MKPFRKALLTATLFAAVGSLALSTFTGIWMACSDIPGFGGEEANVVYTVQQLVAGQPIYTNPGKPPFTITQYAPLYYIVSAGAAACLGVEPTDASTLTQMCRVISLVASLLVAVVVFQIASNRLKLPVAVGVLVACFAFVSTGCWHYLARPDALMSLLLMLAVYLVLHVQPGKGYPNHVYTACAMGVGFLALLTKQNGAQALGLVILYLLVCKAWKELGTALLSVSLMAALVLLCRSPLESWLGHAVKENIIDGVRNGLDPIAAFERTFSPFFRQFSFLLALTAVAAVGFVWGTRCPLRRFLSLATLCLLLFACGTGLKAGSSTNYFIEFTTFAALTSAWYCYGSEQAQTQGTLAMIVLGCVLVFLPFFALETFDRCCYSKCIPRTLHPHPRHQFGSRTEVTQFIRRDLEQSPDAYVWAGECFPVGNLLFPHTVVPQPRIARSSHALGVVNYDEFRSCVQTGKISYVVTRSGHQPTQFLGAGFDRYRKIREVNGYTIYRFAR